MKPWTRRRPFTAVSTVIVFRVSSRIRAAFPETYDRLDHPKGTTTTSASWRTMDIDPFVAYFSTPWSQIGSHYGKDSMIKIGPTLSRSLSTELALTSSFREERRDDERINAREELELGRSYKIKWNREWVRVELFKFTLSLYCIDRSKYITRPVNFIVGFVHSVFRNNSLCRTKPIYYRFELKLRTDG